MLPGLKAILQGVESGGEAEAILLNGLNTLLALEAVYSACF